MGIKGLLKKRCSIVQLFISKGGFTSPALDRVWAKRTQNNECWIKTRWCQTRSLNSRHLTTRNICFCVLVIPPFFKSVFKDGNNFMNLKKKVPNTCICNYLVWSVCLISMNWECHLRLISVSKSNWALDSYSSPICQYVPMPKKTPTTTNQKKTQPKPPKTAKRGRMELTHRYFLKKPLDSD